ncbi:TPR repeat-containing protein ZIP4 [Aristolochia californica]|uniref:TPR repeat-containing protein ZIP4 n=1 Tax=Aristolochia californica TaxID=171875 RepID=UPI0035E2642F
MRISEISPEFRPNSPDSLSTLLGELESYIKDIERLSPHNLSTEKISSKLQNILPRLNLLLPLPETGKLQIWKLSFRLWNGCVDLNNAFDIRSDDGKNRSLLQIFKEEQAKLRQIAADLLLLAGNASEISSPAFKTASFYFRTGLCWHELKMFDLAANCFERATDLTAKIDIQTISNEEEQKLLSDLHIARSMTAWEMSERNLALMLLSRCKNFLFGRSESFKILAEQYLQFGKFVLSKEGKSDIVEALKLFNEALDVCDKGLKCTKRPEEALAFKNLREKTLQFLGATHLLGEELDNVLKCVRVLRETCRTTDEHPSVAFMAMKAYLGQGRHVEAEKELKSIVINKEHSEALCVSAVEAFFRMAGSAGAEVAKMVFFGLLGRCHISAGAALTVTQTITSCGIGSGTPSRMRTKVAAEFVSDERVVALFAGAKEREAMYAVLWNRAADHFRWKEYDVSAEMFEKSMLYVAQDAGNRFLRAKSFRVLCLCHLALSQVDLAEEYINEAEKLDPNISSAFLKFKILLQKKDEEGAINQIQSMVNYVDFKPEFLTLSAHEAMASRALPLAIASLVTLLNLFSSGKQMSLTEVSILRHIISLHLRSQNIDESEILKFTKRARDRSLEIGSDEFFGRGAVGKGELHWFARHSWNMGLTTWREMKFDFCPDFWQLASEFYDGLSDGAEEYRLTVCKASILCVGAMIAREKKTKSTMTDSEAKRALQMVDRAGKMVFTSSSSGGSLAADERSGVEPSLVFIHTSNAYYLKKRIDGGSQKQLIKNFASSKACTVQYLLELGLLVSQGPLADLEDAEFTHQTCLSALLVTSSPNYTTVSFVIRKLVTLAGLRHGETSDEVYNVYKEAYRIMVGLKEGEYPLGESKWLATTAWNRSVLPARLRQVEVAKRWMKMGHELARQVSSLETYAFRMEKCLATLENDDQSS